jgi:hypothetical protein
MTTAQRWDASSCRARSFLTDTPVVRDYQPAPIARTGVGIRLLAALAAERWVGAGVTYGYRENGVVTAECLGVSGTGPTEGAALLDLERRFEARPSGDGWWWCPAGCDLSIETVRGWHGGLLWIAGTGEARGS